MPMLSLAQADAMHAAAEGKSTLDIPPSVGREFVNASQGQNVSSLPEYVQAQQGHKAKMTKMRHRSGKGRKKHHSEAKAHMKAAQKAEPHEAHVHLFRALSSLKKANQ